MECQEFQRSLILVLWQFLRLAALYPERRLHALPDIELLWKTHLIRPIHYRKVPPPPFAD